MGSPLSPRLAAALAAACVLVFAAAVPAPAQVPCTGGTSGAGDATYYQASGTGACGFDLAPADTQYAAMNPTDYDGSAMCGRWIRVTGPLGSADVQVVDLCPVCNAGDIDLAQEIFPAVADPLVGRVPVTWKTIASPDTASVSIYVQPGSNPWYVNLQVRHHRYGIASLEYLDASGYVAAPRQSYNYFTVDANLAITLPVTAPFSVRLTDVHGQTLVIGGLAPTGDTEFVSGQQFPVCSDGQSGIVPGAESGFALLPPSPNPFNPRTTIAFDLPRHGPARVRVFDAAGRLVAVLLDDADMPRGRSEVTWDGRDGSGRRVPSGVYLCRLDSGAFHAVRKLALLQ